mmetsp:Transcript_23207/g.33740  ORF Transcript_23207/g.33740 Transcript_23207/m.33740 type:complete len:93 (-) Transcript_23207:1087-1365(-)
MQFSHAPPPPPNKAHLPYNPLLPHAYTNHVDSSSLFFLLGVYNNMMAFMNSFSLPSKSSLTSTFLWCRRFTHITFITRSWTTFTSSSHFNFS